MTFMPEMIRSWIAVLVLALAAPSAIAASAASPAAAQSAIRDTEIEEILHEGGPAPATPRLRGAIMAVVKNPFAGAFVAEPAAANSVSELYDLY